MHSPIHRRAALGRSGVLIIELEAARRRLLNTSSVSSERSALEQLVAHLHRELAKSQTAGDSLLLGRD